MTKLPQAIYRNRRILKTPFGYSILNSNGYHAKKKYRTLEEATSAIDKRVRVQ